MQVRVPTDRRTWLVVGFLVAALTATDRWHSFAGGFADACRYAITFTDVAAATDSYTLAVGTAPGHGTTVTRDQLDDADVELTYGHS